MKGFTVTALTAQTVVELGCEDKVTQAEDSGQSLRSCLLGARSINDGSWGYRGSMPQGSRRSLRTYERILLVRDAERSDLSLGDGAQLRNDLRTRY